MGVERECTCRGCRPSTRRGRSTLDMVSEVVTNRPLDALAAELTRRRGDPLTEYLRRMRENRALNTSPLVWGEDGAATNAPERNEE